jgi:hypothetical protein
MSEDQMVSAWFLHGFLFGMLRRPAVSGELVERCNPKRVRHPAGLPSAGAWRLSPWLKKDAYDDYPLVNIQKTMERSTIYSGCSHEKW